VPAVPLHHAERGLRKVLYNYLIPALLQVEKVPTGKPATFSAKRISALAARDDIKPAASPEPVTASLGFMICANI
jgi:hypothetical protein